MTRFVLQLTLVGARVNVMVNHARHLVIERVLGWVKQVVVNKGHFFDVGGVWELSHEFVVEVKVVQRNLALFEVLHDFYVRVEGGTRAVNYRNVHFCGELARVEVRQTEGTHG